MCPRGLHRCVSPSDWCGIAPFMIECAAADALAPENNAPRLPALRAMVALSMIEAPNGTERPTGPRRGLPG